MNADKLKRNNIIIGKDGGITKVDEIGWGVVNGLDEDEFYPIPLDESLLFKCGVEAGVHDAEVYYIDILGIDTQIEIMPSLGNWYPSIVQAPEIAPENVQIVTLNYINYLHQLQNLYFVLCGEELNIEL